MAPVSPSGRSHQDRVLYDGGRASGRRSPVVPSRSTCHSGRSRRRPARALGTGAGLGALTGLLRVGGGFLAVPALVTVLAFEMQAAIGTSLLIISVNSPASLLTRGATTSGLDWTLIAPFTGTAILGAWDGKRLAGKV
ncbi:Sulfite exporter TauE/SafE [Streptomyces mirabilis]|uniref:Probable membrane transporter protein n=1 Tax=Streptomyces mirabilis TaxID=68239 RepID=A0A1I2LBI1_9ACTN|nr:Sulfite exporter TauE/SafE [Streptomyces mirabilis]